MNNIYLYEHKHKKNADYNVWLAFPGPEEFGLSSLGFLWLYKTIDEEYDINIETIYTDTKKTVINKNLINALGFSFSFDMDIFNIFTILKQHKIHFKSSDRNEYEPIIFAGGPVITANPEPYTEFFDFFIIGDGENLNLEAIKICKENKDKNKDEILKILSKIDGIYVPKYTNGNINKVTDKLAECIYTPILSDNSFFKNTFIIELQRGCANRCAFCMASYLNLPIRFANYNNIIETIDTGLKYTNKIALLGAQITSHPQFRDICNYIYDKIQNGQNINLSISSMRVDAFCPEIVKLLVAAGQKNTTLAIEAGSERLRKVINKNLTEEKIYNAVKIAHDNGLKGLKFYTMIGIPTETKQDINELLRIACNIKQMYKCFDITFAFSSFVPKPHTPFQWYGREDTVKLEQKVAYLKKEFHKLGIKTQFSSIKWDYYQAVLSRGDNNLCDFLIDVFENGAKLGSLKKCAKNKIDTDHYATENYSYDKKLPWDRIVISPGKEFLKNECEKLLNLK